MLKLDLRVGESVRIGDVAVLTLEAKSGQIARIAIDADKAVPVTRVPHATATNAVAAGGIREQSKAEAIAA